MTKEVKAFKCNYCRRVYLTKAAANRHEFFCFKNSSLYGNCRDCKHCTGKLGTDGFAHSWCEKRQMWILSPVAAQSAPNATDFRYAPAYSAPPLNCEFKEEK